MKVRYFLTDHYSSKCVVAKEMSMRRIDLDRKITIPSAKLGNNRCTSSGGGGCGTLAPLCRSRGTVLQSIIFALVFAVLCCPTLVVLHPDRPLSFVIKSFPPGVAGIEERLSPVIRWIIRRRQSRNPFHFREVHCQPPGIEVISELFERAKPYVLLTRIAPLIVRIRVYRRCVFQRIRIDPCHHLYFPRAAFLTNKDTRLLSRAFLVLFSNSTRNVLDQQPSVVSIESDIESSGSTAQVRCNTSAPHFPHARSPCAEDRHTRLRGYGAL